MKAIALRYFIAHTAAVSNFVLLQHQGLAKRSVALNRSSRITGNLRYIVSASHDGSVRVWDVSTGQDQCCLRLGSVLFRATE
jgi:WD40 repeat protein